MTCIIRAEPHELIYSPAVCPVGAFIISAYFLSFLVCMVFHRELTLKRNRKNRNRKSQSPGNRREAFTEYMEVCDEYGGQMRLSYTEFQERVYPRLKKRSRKML